MSPRERQGGPADVASKLGKAVEFLDVAQAALAGGQYNAACSNAVLAAVNANDAACLAKLGKYSTAQHHREAVALAREIGTIGKEIANKLERLLGIKDKAQYSTFVIGERDAREAVRRAADVVELARSAR